MSGEGVIPVRACPAFDQRPGALEAARIEPRSGILVTGGRPRAKNGSEGWKVLCIVNGEDGTFCQVSLRPDEARKLAAELADMANVIDGIVW